MDKNKKVILFTSLSVILFALGLAAFTPFDGISQVEQPTGQEDDSRPAGDHLQRLADALGIPLEDLQAAYTAAAQTAREQWVSETLDKGLITQERADMILNGEIGGGRRGHKMGFSGVDFDELVAQELGIPLEEYQAARQQVYADRIEEAVAQGEITQTMADLMLARNTVDSYFDEAWTSAYQAAVQNALADGVITQAQADLLLENMTSGTPGGFGRTTFSPHRGH